MHLWQENVDRIVKIVPAGKRLYFRTSQRTSLLGSRVNGSLNMRTGMRNMSLLEPSAWYVLEPSKFHSGISDRVSSNKRLSLKYSIYQIKRETMKIKITHEASYKFITCPLNTTLKMEVFQCTVNTLVNICPHTYCSGCTRMLLHLCKSFSLTS